MTFTFVFNRFSADFSSWNRCCCCGFIFFKLEYRICLCSDRCNLIEWNLIAIGKLVISVQCHIRTYKSAIEHPIFLDSSNKIKYIGHSMNIIIILLLPILLLPLLLLLLVLLWCSQACDLYSESLNYVTKFTLKEQQYTQSHTLTTPFIIKQHEKR